MDWTMGGTIHHEDGSVESIDPDLEPEFDDLHRILEVVTPKITYLQYRKLCREIVTRTTQYSTDHDEERQYLMGVKKVSLKDLEKYLKTVGLV